MWCRDHSVKRSYIENEPNDLPNRITTHTILCKVISLLKNRYEENIISEMLKEADVVEEALALLKNPKPLDNMKISFIIEQLSLTILKPWQRRYSSSLLAMAVMWQKISSAAYKHLYQEGILTLPSESRIRQLTYSIGVDMELGDSTKAYLYARKSKLQPKDCLIPVIID